MRGEVKLNKMMILGITFIILISAVVVVLLLYINLKKDYTLQLEKSQRHENTIRLLQREDIQELLSHIKQIMRGEVIYEIDMESENLSLLAAYSLSSHQREIFPSLNAIEAELTVLEISLNGKYGEIIVSYFINLLDSAGELLSSRHVGSEAPTRWMIEQKEGKWTIVDIVDFKMWRLSNSCN